MEDITMGMEIELHANKIGTNYLVKLEHETSPRPSDLPILDGIAVAGNELINITLEFGDDLGKAKIEVTTPVESTQSREEFRISTEYMLDVVKHLYYFISVAMDEENKYRKIKIYERGSKKVLRRRYRNELKGFVRYYNRVLQCLDRSPAFPKLLWKFDELDKYPELRKDKEKISRLQKNKIKFKLSTLGLKRGLVPRLAPQITFSMPLERVSVFFSARKARFNPAPVTQARPFTAQLLEEASAKIGVDFVEGTLDQYKEITTNQRGIDIVKQVRRKHDKWKGFATLVAYHLLGYLLRGQIAKSTGRSQCTKDDFRFLVKSNLQSLYFDGLSKQDRMAIVKYKGRMEHPLMDLPMYVLVQATKNVRKKHVEQDSIKMIDNDVKEWLRSIWKEEGKSGKSNYEKKTMKLFMKYALYKATEQRVKRKHDVKLERVLLEYRRFSSKEGDKKYKNCQSLAAEVSTLYNILQQLQKASVDDRIKSEKKVGRRSYYKPLRKLNLDKASISQWDKITIKVPKGDKYAEKWWASVAR